MEYMTVRDAARRWGVTERLVQRLCADGRISGAEKFAGSWRIPEGAPKPVDPRRTPAPSRPRRLSSDHTNLMPLMSSAFEPGHAREFVESLDAGPRADIARSTATVELDGAKYTATSEQAIPALGHDFQDGVCTRCGEKDPSYVAPAGTDEPQKPESESDELPDAVDASLPALAAAVAGSLLCLVAVPRLRRR